MEHLAGCSGTPAEVDGEPSPNSSSGAGRQCSCKAASTKHRAKPRSRDGEIACRAGCLLRRSTDQEGDGAWREWARLELVVRRASEYARRVCRVLRDDRLNELLAGLCACRRGAGECRRAVRPPRDEQEISMRDHAHHIKPRELRPELTLRVRRLPPNPRTSAHRPRRRATRRQVVMLASPAPTAP